MKMDLDQQMIVAKLKRLENNAELNRINIVTNFVFRSYKIGKRKVSSKN